MRCRLVGGGNSSPYSYIGTTMNVKKSEHTSIKFRIYLTHFQQVQFSQNADINAAINILRRKPITNKNKKVNKSRYLRRAA